MLAVIIKKREKVDAVRKRVKGTASEKKRQIVKCQGLRSRRVK